jgi:hypothetical protein
MRRLRVMRQLRSCATGALLLWAASPALAQEVVLDKQLAAGGLTLLPSVNSPNDYYYVADRVALAKDSNGLPQFSFLQYVVGNVVADATTREAAGGGVVHALVELQVPPELVRQAGQELRRTNANGRVVGPVPFQSGKFALISSAADPGSPNGFSDKVLGIGSAPVFEGEKAAVSIRLNKLGSQVLWESFHAPTPDVSFSFEMVIDGYRSPKRALLVADFDRIYSERTFQAGVATTYLQAEIDAAYDSLRRTGAIQLTEIGDDQEQAALVRAAYDKLIEIMFEKAPSSGAESLPGAATGSQSMLDRASNLLETRRKETRDENTALRERNKEQAQKNAAAAESQTTADDLARDQGNDQTLAQNKKKRAEQARDRARQLRQLAAAAGTSDADKATYLQLAQEQEQQAGKSEQEASALEASAQQKAAKVNDAKAKAAHDQAAVKPVEQEKSLPGIAVVASFKMKESRQSGSFRIDLNKYTAASKTFTFVENIGDLRAYLNDNQVFRSVDLGSSAYEQREIPVYLDAEDLTTFGSTINYAVVSLQRRHDSGQVSTDDVRIDRANFQQSANNFKLSYRKLNDAGAHWLDYQYRVDWSAFGGAAFQEPWRNAATSGITLSLPVVKRTLMLEADPAKVASLGIRAIDFKLFYKIKDLERTKELTLLASKPEGLSQQLDFVLPRGQYEYEYQIDWTLRDRQVTSGRRRSSAGFLTLDEVPNP